MAAAVPRALRRIAVAQMCSSNDVEANLRVCESLIQRAASLGSLAVFLPEASDYISTSREEAMSLAQPLTGPFLSVISAAAARHRIMVAIGVHERVSPDDGDPRFYNSHVLIDSTGSVVDVYRKVVRSVVGTRAPLTTIFLPTLIAPI